MPWKLIGFLIILVLFLVFAGFNVHPVTIYLGPMALEGIPMFVGLLFAFIAGALVAIPFSIVHSVRKSSKIRKKIKQSDKSHDKKALTESVQKTGTPTPEECEETDSGRTKKESGKKEKK